MYALYTCFKVWKLCHTERDLNLREEAIYEAYANLILFQVWSKCFV